MLRAVVIVTTEDGCEVLRQEVDVSEWSLARLVVIQRKPLAGSGYLQRVGTVADFTPDGSGADFLADGRHWQDVAAAEDDGDPC